MHVIPLQQQPEKFRLQIGVRTIEFRTFYTATTDKWNMDLYENSDPLVNGISLLNGIDILTPYNLRLGAIRMVDIRESFLDANSATFGVSVLMVHFTDEEYKALLFDDVADVVVPVAYANDFKEPYL